MRELVSKEGIVQIYERKEKVCGGGYNCFGGVDYTIVQTDILDIDKAEMLLSNNFLFHDRKFRMEINIEETGEIRNKRVKRVKALSMCEKNELTEEIYILACQVFNFDRRFHLEHRFNQQLANAMIEAYFNDLRKRKIIVIEARCKDELLGCIIVEKHEKGTFENVLGFTKGNIKGKMVAGELYNYTLEFIAQNQNEKYTKYYGDVSTINLNSINLHIQLGAKIKEIYDEYIYIK